MEDEIVDIIVTVYNAANTLEKCLRSLINQKKTHAYKIIVVDDGSTDSSKEICDKYAELNNSILVYHTSNKGRASARNYGLSKATGAYIMFVDSDDWVEPNFCFEALQCIKNNNCDIVTFGYYKNFDSGLEKRIDLQIEGEYDHLSKQMAYSFLLNDTIGSYPWNKIYKRKLFKNIRYPEGKNFEDLATTYKIFNNARDIGVLNKYLYHYYQNQNSIMHSISVNTMRDILYARKQLSEFIIDNYPALQPIVYDELVNEYLQYMIINYKGKKNDSWALEAQNFLEKVKIRDTDLSIKVKLKLYLFIYQRWLFNFFLGVKNLLR